MAIYSPTHSRTSLITPTTHPRLLPPVLPISTHLDTRFVTYTSQDAETIPDAASNPVELERHPDLWFEDGSIVLRAENTLFLVHMSQLSRHSVCFRDMFSMPQLKQGPLATAGAASSSKIVAHSGELEKLVLDDGQECSVVYLHDAAEDLGNLLTALYDGP